jgi:hypothetical protein
MRAGKQMTQMEYLNKCAKDAVKNGESLEQFVSQFVDSKRAAAIVAYMLFAQLK